MTEPTTEPAWGQEPEWAICSAIGLGSVLSAAYHRDCDPDQ